MDNINYDQEIEKMYHPENFEPVKITDEDIEIFKNIKYSIEVSVIPHEE